MRYYLLVCRSLTYAQRAQRALSSAGITARLVRTAQDTRQEGCGYSLKIGESALEKALAVLEAAGVPPRSLQTVLPDGTVTEGKR